MQQSRRCSRIGTDRAEATADIGGDDMDFMFRIVEMRDATVRMTCGAWKVPQTVSSPFTLSKEATAWQVSSGDGWVR
jgi:hypothetical protein